MYIPILKPKYLVASPLLNHMKLGYGAQFTTGLLLIQMPTDLLQFILDPEPLQYSLSKLCSLSKLIASPLT